MAARRGLNKGRGLGSLIPPREKEPAAEGVIEQQNEEKGPAQEETADKTDRKKSDGTQTAPKRKTAAEKTVKQNTADKKKEEQKDEQTIQVKISQIVPNQSQPRKQFDEESLETLADSIRQFGILQPLLVRKKGRYYELVAGERRWRAARMAGLKEVPVILRPFTVQDAAAIALIENIQREDLNPIEEAEAYRRLIDEFGLTQEEAAARVSRSRTAVTNSLRLLRLTEPVREMVIKGELTMGHARALLALENEKQQNDTAALIVRRRLSVRDTEKLIRKMLEPEKQETDRKPAWDSQLESALHALEEGFKRRLGTRVRIRQTGREQGKIEIEYYSMSDLDRLSDLIRGEEEI